MKEDIKILEDLAETLNKTCENGICEASMSIEKLIKGYRELEKHIAFYEKHGSYKARILELEESLDNSRKANKLLNKTNNELRLEIRTTYSKVVNDIISKFNLGDDYIPKSKVKELHKEYYEKAFAEPYDCTTADYKHSQAIGGWRALNKLLMED